ncbi:hypothetical protein V496_00311 [Pseudogymnoascus sp. VKM F-4515 (FW-2607)]|nr:hypothetical protein V496_00311 [Pseudogymnoascus sp. VKM F-4515 (FW-2607)]
MAAFVVDALALHIDLKRAESDDPRVGSARNGSTGGTLASATKGTNTSSITGLVATLIPVMVYAAVCMLIFWGCRTRYPRVYSPRTILSSLESHERPKKLPTGWFNWFKPLFKTPDLDVLHKSSIDGFLFLRFLRVLCVICLFGACVTWPVLFPLHILGGGNGSQLDSLTFGNVKEPSWYFVHAFLAWIFFGFIMYMISRECVYYINLRQAYLLSPYYAKRLSSRTVLFTCVPEQFRDEARLRKLFGDSVKNVWLPTYSGDLDDLVKERNQTAFRLEDAEIELIRLANVERNKVLRNGKSDIEANTPGGDGVEKAVSAESGNTAVALPDLPGGPASALGLTSASPLDLGDGAVASPSGLAGGASVAIPELAGGAASPSESNDGVAGASSSDLNGKAAATPSDLTDGTIASPSGLTDSTLASPSGQTNATVVSPASASTGTTLVSPSSASTGGATMVKSITKDSKNETSSIAQTQSQTPNLDSPNTEWPELKWGIQRGIPDVRGSVAAQWIPVHWRPSHRPLANYGRRVDTIRWTRNRLKQLSPRIAKLRRQHRAGNARRMPAAFIEFDTLSNAQSAYQTLPHHRPFHMTPHINGIRPEEIVWSTLRMKWWERIIRGFAAIAVVAVMVVFWSLPAAGIALITKIDFLTENIPFLAWIDKLPKPILGLITGLLPAVALSLLMAVAPVILRVVLYLPSRPSLPCDDPHCGHIRLSLAATRESAVGTKNTVGESSESLQLLRLVPHPAGPGYERDEACAPAFASSGRVCERKDPEDDLDQVAPSKEDPLGERLPNVCQYGCDCYSCIAPIILGFGAMCFYLVHKVYHYNLLYVYSSEVDTRGLLYPHALKQILVGVYLAEICLFGLFGIQAAVGPLIMMLILVIFTVLVHISVNDALGPLLYNLPRSLAVQGLYDDLSEELPVVVNTETQYDSDFDPGDPNGVTHEEIGSRAVEGTKGYSKVALRFLSSSMQEKLSSKGGSVSSFFKSIDFWTPWISPDGTDPNPNFLLKWLHPEVYHDFSALRARIPADLPDPDYTPELLREAGSSGGEQTGGGAFKGGDKYYRPVELAGDEEEGGQREGTG